MNTLKSFRTRRGFSLSQLAELTKIDERRLGELERGQRLASPSECGRLSKVGCHFPPAEAYLRPSELVPQWWTKVFELETYPTEAWETALTYREASLPEWFRLSTPCHSKFEADRWLDLADRGACPRLASPLALGFRQHHLVDEQSLGLGERVRPCLRLQELRRTLLVFPQVKVRTQRNQFQLDGLGLLFGEGERLWFDLEWDGGGHDSSKDEYRQRQLSMPEIRVKTDTWVRLWQGVDSLVGCWLNRR